MADLRKKPTERMTDEQRRQASDPELLAAVRSVVRVWTAKRPRLADEIESAAMLAVCRAVASYDAAHGATLRTWVIYRVTTGIIDGLRAEESLGMRIGRQSRKRGDAPGVLPTSERLGCADGRHLTLADTIPADDLPVGWETDSIDAVTALSRKLPPKYGEALRAYLLRPDLGGRMAAVAAAIGTSESRVCQMLNDSVRLLRPDGSAPAPDGSAWRRPKPSRPKGSRQAAGSSRPLNA